MYARCFRSTSGHDVATGLLRAADRQLLFTLELK